MSRSSWETMQTFNLNGLMAESGRGDQRWQEFLRVPSLCMDLAPPGRSLNDGAAS